MSEMEPGLRAHAAYCRATGMDAYTTEKDWALYEGTHAAWASVEAALAQPDEGWVMVPKEPTWWPNAMVQAGAACLPAEVGRDAAGQVACAVYRAMLSAAPKPPSQAEEPQP